jgi:hypothetical protein
MASAGKNHLKARKTTKGTYGKQLAVVRKNFSVGEILTIEVLNSRFPAIFPGNGPSNAGKFFEEARRKGHLATNNALLAPKTLTKESLPLGASPAPLNGNGDDGTHAIDPKDDATFEVALFWDGEPLKKGERFKAGQLRNRKPFFKKYYAASIGQFLLELSKKKRPLLSKNTDGTWSLTEEGLKRQRELRAPRVVSPVSLVKTISVEVAKPSVPVRAAAVEKPVAVVAPIPTLEKEILMSFSPAPKLMDPRTYKLGQKFVKLLEICRQKRITVINDSVIYRIFKEFGQYKNEKSLSCTIYNQAQKGVIFEALDQGGYGFRSDYIAAVDAGFYGSDAVSSSQKELSPPLAPEPAVAEEQTEVGAVEPLPEPVESVDEASAVPSKPEPEPEPAPALSPAASDEGDTVEPELVKRHRVSQRRRFGTSLDSAMQKLDEARKTVEGLSALVEGFPQKVQEIVGAALAAQAQRFETQLAEHRAHHAEQMQAQREQTEALRCRVNVLEKDAVTLGILEDRVGGLEEDFGAAQELVALAKHAGQVLSKLHQ